MERYGPNAYPTSAYLLLLAKLDEKLDYVPIDEGTLDVGDRLTLVRKGDTVGEYRGIEVIRSFKLQNGIPVEIDWGGATSSLLFFRVPGPVRSPYTRRTLGSHSKGSSWE